MKRNINKITGILLTFIILLGFIPIKNAYAAGEFFYVNNSKVNAHTGTVLVDTRISTHGNLVHRAGDKIEGTTYYQIGSNGQMTGKPFICVEVGTQFSSYNTYGENASKYTRHGEYNNERLKAFISFMNYKGMHKFPTLMQMASWSILGQVKLDEGQATQLLAEFEREYAKDPNSNIFKGAKLYEYRDTIYDGQRLISYEYDKINEYDLHLLKESENKSLTDLAKASYNLTGAKYGIYKSKENAKNNIESLGVLTTDNSGNTNNIKLTSGLYFVKEISAPKGFKLDKNIYTVDLSKGDAVLKVKDKIKYDPLNIMLKKIDSNGKKLPGSEFKVNYYDGIHNDVSKLKPIKTWKFRTNENGYFAFDDKYKIEGDELFVNNSGTSIGLIGTYEFIETKAPLGYILNSQNYLANVKDNGENKYTGNTGTIYNAPIVKNGYQKLIVNKIDTNTSENIKDVTNFKIYFNNKDISSKFIGVSGKYVYQDKVSKNAELSTDKLGQLEVNGLPNGKYEIVESKAPIGYLKSNEMHSIIIDNSAVKIDIPNVRIPSISTKFVKINSNEKTLDPIGTTELVDIVEYKNLHVGDEYTLKLIVMDKSTGKALVLNDKIVENEINFIAKSENGKINVPIKLDTALLKGKTLVAFEELSYKDEIISSHRDINDKNQTIKITNPDIKTKASDSVSGEKNHIPTEMVTIKDEVSYKDLIVGKEYTIKGKLIDKATKEVIKNVNGVEINSELTFSPVKSEGKIELLFNVEGSLIRGKETVVFEDLFYKDKLLVSHADINDKNQTTWTVNPKIQTKFFEKNTQSKELFAEGFVELVDLVEYSDLLVNKEYNLDLIVMNKSTNKPLLDKQGNPIQSSIIFTPKTQSGSIQVPIKIDISNLENQEIVAFEKLYFKDQLIASHEDIDDADQTIKINEKPIIIKKEIPKTIEKATPIITLYDNPNTGDPGVLGFVSIILVSIFLFLFTRKSKIS